MNPEAMFEVLELQTTILLNIERKLHHMSTQLDALTAQVTANSSLLGALKADLDAAIASQPTDDGAALQALSDKLGTDDAALAAAVAANTPAAPAA